MFAWIREYKRKLAGRDWLWLVCGGVVPALALALATYQYRKIIWHYVGPVVTPAWPVWALLGISGSILVVRDVRRHYLQRSTSSSSHFGPVYTQDWVIALAVITMTVIGVVSLKTLLGLADQAPNDQRVSMHMSAIKDGLTLVAGGGALALFLLTLRKQRLAEHTEERTQNNEKAGQAVDLYKLAAEQLGSGQGASVLAGLYAFELLGQSFPDYRQTVVDMWCAFLRMPFSPPATVNTGGSVPPAQDEQLATQQMQLRITAQELLERHLHPDDDNFWRKIHLNLSGAILAGFALRSCRVRMADFTGAIFASTQAGLSPACFDGTVFEDEARFTRANFSPEWPASFVRTVFAGQLDMRGTKFAVMPDLRGTTH